MAMHDVYEFVRPVVAKIVGYNPVTAHVLLFAVIQRGDDPGNMERFAVTGRNKWHRAQVGWLPCPSLSAL
jgi:hypothetical protein